MKNIKGDLLGGGISAIVTLPGNVALGMLALAALGPDYIGVAVTAGMLATIYASSIACLVGKTPILISGPGVSSALILAGVAQKLISQENIGDPGGVLAVVFMVVVLSGIFQILFGLLRLGNVVKFISYPVMAGIINGSVVLIFINQAGPFLGLGSMDFGDLFQHLSKIKILTPAVAALTLGLSLFGNRLLPKIPGAIIGVLGGTTLFYLLVFAGLADGAGATLGPIKAELPSLKYISHMQITFTPEFIQYFPLIASAALSIALLNSVYSMFAAVYLKSITGIRPDCNVELVGQGLGNLIAGSLGGMPANGKISRSMLNYNSGGRTKLSVVFSSLSMLVIIILFSGVIGKIPRPVITGIMIYIGVMIFDRWMVKLVKDLFFRKAAHYSEGLVNLAIAIMVLLITVIFSLTVAVAVGVVVSIIIFIAQMSRSVVRRTYYGSHLKSKKQRSDKAMDILAAHKEKIAIVELEGSLFFGSADNLDEQMEKISDNQVCFIVLDMKRLTHIDITGARVLSQSRKQLAKNSCRLIISYLSKDDPKYAVMQDIGAIDALGQDGIFSDTSLAVEYCEDELLASLPEYQEEKDKVNLASFFEYQGLSASEADILNDYLVKKEYEPGEYIVRSGDKDDSIFFLEQGSADVLIQLSSNNRYKRLQTLLPGSIVGEMAVLDGEPRSADIMSNGKSTCYVLTRNRLEEFKKEHPELALSFFAVIARNLSRKLRAATRTIFELET